MVPGIYFIVVQLSILIRNLNEAKQLEQTLLALKRQQVNFEYEILVIDNESDDNSAEIAKRMGCTVFSLKRADFSFGRSLNYGIEKCKGEIILILSAHVILLNEFFLQNIPRQFNDAKIAALRFVNAVSTEHVADSLQGGPQQLIYSDTPDFITISWKNFMVNHCAAVRRSCWKIQPFDEKAFASEDKIWSIEILKKRYVVLYNVPGFYVYVKPFSTEIKIKRMVIEESAKEMITGKTSSLFDRSYAGSVVKKISSGIKRIAGELKIHKQVYKGVKKSRKKYNDPVKPK